MKKFMTDIRTLAALLMAGAAMTACSSDDNIIDEQPVNPAQKTYTLTVNAAKGDGATTRALTLDGSTLNATWATTEKVYVKKDAWSESNYLQPQANAATATLTGDLSGMTIAADDVLTLQFPKSGDITYEGQVGTLADIAANFDYATATVEVESVSATGDITPKTATTTFTNQQAIVKFTLKDKATGNAINASSLTVSAAGLKTSASTTGDVTITPASATSEIWAALSGISSADVTINATINGSSYTFTKSGVTFANGQYYAITVSLAPVGAIRGGFTVNEAGAKVYFSKGNLQYIGTWQFAENQYDYLSADQEDNHRDLFCWGTKSNPNDVSKEGTYSWAEWGENVITNGGSSLGWRTMTKDEWEYVFNTRTSGSTVNSTSNARYTCATINTGGTGVNGIILFPDGVTIAAGEATTWGSINSGSEWGTKCTKAQWTALETKGCVFLPAAGYRDPSWEGGGLWGARRHTPTRGMGIGGDESVQKVGESGYYWTSSSATKPYGMVFEEEFDWSTRETNVNIECKNNDSYIGSSVRLVCNPLNGEEIVDYDED